MSTKESCIQELTKKLEREKQARLRAEANLASVRQDQQDFISLIAHELRIPMTAIQGYTDLLIKAIMGPVNETQLTFLKTIRSNVERMSRLIADLSDINKIKANSLEIKLKEVSLPSLLNGLEADFESMTIEKNISLSLVMPDTLPPIKCDADRLCQVLTNLLRNAVQYTPSGGEVSIHAALDPDQPQCVQVQVSDSGIGIPPDQQSYVFDMFFRASDNETRQTSGNGLALHLSKLLLEMQDGTIGFVSTRGKGSTFTITLPAVQKEWYAKGASNNGMG
jgi:signal transduction histidine kinase